MNVQLPTPPRKNEDLLDYLRRLVQALEFAFRKVSSHSNSQPNSGEYVRVEDYEDIDVLNKIKNVDGPGSGLDADTLDGQHANAFALASHSHNQYVLISDYEDIDVLNKIKNVDGSGSGLDADTLDGQHANAFASSSHTHLKSHIIDLEAITTTPTGNAIPKAQSSGKIKNTWIDRSIYEVFVTDFGADPTGNSDSTQAFNDAINALPNNGGIVYVPPGVYKIDGTIQIGNGTTTQLSTKNGVKLVGLGALHWDAFPTNSSYSSPILRRYGSSTDPILKINGTVFGCEIKNLNFRGTNTIAKVIDAIGLSGCSFFGIRVNNFGGIGINFDMVQHSSRLQFNSLKNNFQFIYVNSSIDGCIGIRIGSTNTQSTEYAMDWARNFFSDIEIRVNGHGLYIDFADNNYFSNILLSNNGTSYSNIKLKQGEYLIGGTSNYFSPIFNVFYNLMTDSNPVVTVDDSVGGFDPFGTSLAALGWNRGEGITASIGNFARAIEHSHGSFHGFWGGNPLKYIFNSGPITISNTTAETAFSGVSPFVPKRAFIWPWVDIVRLKVFLTYSQSTTGNQIFRVRFGGQVMEFVQIPASSGGVVLVEGDYKMVNGTTFRRLFSRYHIVDSSGNVLVNQLNGQLDKTISNVAQNDTYFSFTAQNSNTSQSMSLYTIELDITAPLIFNDGSQNLWG